MSTTDIFLVIGGELSDLSGTKFRDAASVHLVGAFADRDDAVSAWRSNAQRTVDNALMRYFIIPLNFQQMVDENKS